jgi:hypothetical protein
MDFVLALIILGCLFYAGKCVLEYASHSAIVQPLIDHALAEVNRLADTAEEEAVHAATIRERVEVLRSGLVGVRSQVQTLRGHVDRERERQSRLQMAATRERFRRSRRVSAA